jgi:hypothetical protein
LLNLDERPGQARASTIEKQSHAQGLCTLQSHQAHLPANVIAIEKLRYHRFVAFGIPFQPGDAVLNGATKPGTDLVAFIDGTIGKHGGLLGAGNRAEKSLRNDLKFFLLEPMLTKTHERRQITKYRDLGNRVYENEAGAETVTAFLGF